MLAPGLDCVWRSNGFCILEPPCAWIMFGICSDGLGTGDFPGLGSDDFPGLGSDVFVGLARMTFLGLAWMTFPGLAWMTFLGLARMTFLGLARMTFQGLAWMTFPGLAWMTFLGLARMTFPGLGWVTLLGLGLLWAWMFASQPDFHQAGGHAATCPQANRYLNWRARMYIRCVYICMRGLATLIYTKQGACQKLTRLHRTLDLLKCHGFQVCSQSCS